MSSARANRRRASLARRFQRIDELEARNQPSPGTVTIAPGIAVPPIIIKPEDGDFNPGIPIVPGVAMPVDAIATSGGVLKIPNNVDVTITGFNQDNSPVYTYTNTAPIQSFIINLLVPNPNIPITSPSYWDPGETNPFGYDNPLTPEFEPPNDPGPLPAPAVHIPFTP